MNKRSRILRRPSLVGPILVHAVSKRMRAARLRRNYDGLVANVPEGVELVLPDIPLRPAGELPARLSADAARIRDEAEAILRHEVDYLGSGPAALGEQIDWHRDFKSGHVWPSLFYRDVRITRLNDASDAKVPWELSRGHQLLTLARAAVLYDDARFADEVELQLASWLDDNPPGCGINWTNSMEIAIRAVNWLWALGTLQRLRPIEPELRRRVTRSLQAHGRHIALNLEGSPLLRGNHYLADVVGLHALATYLPGDPHARRWSRLARRALEREVLRQVHEDGVNFEASVPYHGLALELFLVARIITPLTSRYDERVRRMTDLARAVRQPDGRRPVIGDDDSGRVLPGGFNRPPSFDPLLSLAGLVYGETYIPAAPDPEVAWTLGVEAWERAALLPAAPPPPHAFQHGGFYVLRGGGTHVVVRCGDVGQNGNGGHAHNDVLSYELARGGAIVVDPGTYVYTADPAARDAFRSTRAHNTVVIDGDEINPLPAGQPFSLRQEATPRVLELDERHFCGEHDGYARLPGRVVHRRTLEVDSVSGSLSVTDELRGGGDHRVEVRLHLAPDVEAEVEADVPSRVVLKSATDVLTLTFAGSDVAVVIEPTQVSDRYGVRTDSRAVVALRIGPLPFRVRHTLSPAVFASGSHRHNPEVPKHLEAV